MYQSWTVVSVGESFSAETIVPRLKELQQQGWLLIGLLETNGTEKNHYFSTDTNPQKI